MYCISYTVYHKPVGPTGELCRQVCSSPTQIPLQVDSAPTPERRHFIFEGGAWVGVRSNPVFWINIYKCIWPAHLNNVPGFYNLYYRVVLSSIFCFCEVCQLEYSVHGYILIISNIIHCWYLFYISFIYFSVFVYVQCTLVLSV